MMSEMLVSFKNPEEILNFVNTVAKYPYDMDMKRGRFVVDAKSILGIMKSRAEQRDITAGLR